MSEQRTTAVERALVALEERFAGTVRDNLAIELNSYHMKRPLVPSQLEYCHEYWLEVTDLAIQFLTDAGYLSPEQVVAVKAEAVRQERERIIAILRAHGSTETFTDNECTCIGFTIRLTPVEWQELEGC